MKLYRNWSPTGHDSRGLNLPDRQDWLVSDIGRNRDSEIIDESNWTVQEAALAAADPDGIDHEVHRFGHWACGWFEIALVRPGTAAHTIVETLGDRVADYPILDENDYSEREMHAADETWRHCYTARQRVEYIRRNRNQFDFLGFADMLGCVRGHYFAGYASELVRS